MSFVEVSVELGCAELRLSRGKVNAINEEVVDQLHAEFEGLRGDESVRAVTLTGTGAFFSFGFDIPWFYEFAREDFTRYLTKFAELINYIFMYPKPVIAAVNGHAIAGGCMLASACDHRVMVTGKAKISLNEITFGATVFQGATEQMRYWVGSAMTQEMLFSGAMYSAEQAEQFGLIQQAVNPEELKATVSQTVDRFARLEQPAFASLKKLLREPVVEGAARKEADAIEEFVNIWYSDGVRENLRKIEIRD
ncbi:MAG: enoyl-CoA hydratase/isomerase family protein [Candidatus Zixiibacteriota bacterium]|nr:MAG: enoyl-CoA hydratase/isomerase family protein [candidate division Zixibacteria bacterium]